MLFLSVRHLCLVGHFHFGCLIFRLCQLVWDLVFYFLILLIVVHMQVAKRFLIVAWLFKWLDFLLLCWLFLFLFWLFYFAEPSVWYYLWCEVWHICDNIIINLRKASGTFRFSYRFWSLASRMNNFMMIASFTSALKNKMLLLLRQVEVWVDYLLGP